ncbi:MAG: phosphotransferase [Pseudomonadota bacterium]
MVDSTFYPVLKERFRTLLRECCSFDLVSMEFVPGDASKREYFRLRLSEGSLIGVYGHDEKESRSFEYFCNHFYSLRLPVPKLYASSIDQGVYIVEDLGEETLAKRISDPAISREEVVSLYIQSVKDLVHFQILGHRGLDYENNCHQRPVLDRKNIEEDLGYFTKYFLSVANDFSSLSGIDHELDKLTDILAEPQPMFFLYRDFQCRNIIVRPDKSLGYVDFQAGRKGPLQYDVATLLYASQANISDEEREVVLVEYLDQLERVMDSQGNSEGDGSAPNSVRPIGCDDFMAKYYFFVLLRILRALGIYLFLAKEGEHWRFLGGVPSALKNLMTVFSTHGFLGDVFPHLQEFADRLSEEEIFLSPESLMKLIKAR